MTGHLTILFLVPAPVTQEDGSNISNKNKLYFKPYFARYEYLTHRSSEVKLWHTNCSGGNSKTRFPY